MPRRSDQARTRARDRALQWLWHEQRSTWEILCQVVRLQDPDAHHTVHHQRAKGLALRWIRAYRPDVWYRFLDEAWAELGGKLVEGRPRKGST